MELLRKYGVAATIIFPMIKAGAQYFAATGDWTPVAADSGIRKDAGSFAQTTNAVAVVSGEAMWSLTLTATEMEAARIVVKIIDAATKAVEDQCILLSTYGNTSAEHAFDLDDAQQTVGIVSGGIPVGAFAAGAITAAALASNAITAAKIASNAITAAKIASNAITAAKIASDAIDAAKIADGALTDAKFAADIDVYSAKVWLIDDEVNNTDRWSVTFYKNGAQAATTGTPDLWVFKLDGTPTNLLGTSGSPQSLTEAGSTDVWFHDETDAEDRIVDGIGYMARVRATIDGSTRTCWALVGRDSA